MSNIAYRSADIRSCERSEQFGRVNEVSEPDNRLLCEVVNINLLCTIRVHACGVYQANEHEYEIVQGGSVHGCVVREMSHNARVDDAYRHGCVNECGLSLYEGVDVSVFH